jgi:uncharacterized iron-regulated protein
MGLGSDVGKNTGLSAVQEAHKAVDDAIPQVERAGEVLVEKLHQALVELGGSIERMAGSLAISLGGLPEQITTALDGLTVTVQATIKISRKGE